MQGYRNFAEAVEAIIKQHPQYHTEAYFYMHRAMERASSHFSSNGQRRHLSAEELYLACCTQALEEYGPLAIKVLENWGIHSAQDMGQIVYKLIEVGIFSSQPEDRLEDFYPLPPLCELLEQPYLCD